MPTSIPGMSRNSRRPAGFTLVELSIVLFLLGLILWIAAPRLAAIGGDSREAAIRKFSANSEAAFDGALFEKKEWRLQIDPGSSSYRFYSPGSPHDSPEDRHDFGNNVTITGITIEGDDRRLDAVSEVRYLPGGRLADLLIRLKDASNEAAPSAWTLHLDPVTGSVDVIEGNLQKDA